MGHVLASIGSLFKPPDKPKVATMPDPESQAAKEAARQKVLAASTQGRAGTIYSGVGPSGGGGGTYTGSKLGGTA